MVASRLTLYNGALRLVAERPLASLTESREARRVLDAIWDGDIVRRCLQAGQWNHATRTVELTASPSIDPEFGFQYAFDRPDDFVRTVGLSNEGMFTRPWNYYREEGPYWFTDIDTIYLRYVSDDVSYGMDLSLWPANFAAYVEAAMAYEACFALNKSEATRQIVEKERKRRLSAALATDAQAGPTSFAPVGTWAMARGGWWGRRYREHG